jgi:hypothetical protein
MILSYLFNFAILFLFFFNKKQSLHLFLLEESIVSI